MKLLLPGKPYLIFQPEIAETLSINEAVVLQRLHYLLDKNSIFCEGHYWYFHTIEQWEKQFPFWSERTIIRIFSKLEKEGYIITSKHYNKMKIDRTKWYRINFDKFYFDFKGQLDNSERTTCQDRSCQCASQRTDNMSSPITKEVINIKERERKENTNVEMNLDPVSEIINYLNAKTSKQFKTNTNSKYIMERLQEGYTLDNLKQVVDLKASQWLHDSKMNMYLRPSTLFSMKNFENYLNESYEVPSHSPPEDYGFTKLDFTDGEDDDWAI